MMHAHLMRRPIDSPSNGLSSIALSLVLIEDADSQEGVAVLELRLLRGVEVQAADGDWLFARLGLGGYDHGNHGLCCEVVELVIQTRPVHWTEDGVVGLGHRDSIEIHGKELGKLARVRRICDVFCKIHTKSSSDSSIPRYPRFADWKGSTILAVTGGCVGM